MLGESFRSEDKFDVETFTKPDGSDWVAVHFKNGTTWIPSFEDLYRIIHPIANIEDRKYPKRRPDAGRDFTANFFALCCGTFPWSEIKKKFMIPDRTPENSRAFLESIRRNRPRP